MRLILFTSVAISLGLLATSATAQDRRVREKCEVGRCVYYESGRRVGSVTRDDTGRYVVRDEKNNIRAKVSRDEDGSVRIQKPRR